MLFFADLIYFYIANRIDFEDQNIFENIAYERNKWNNINTKNK